jgi:hypothetical protein
LIEKLSWSIPEVEIAYQRIKDSTLSVKRLESEADRLTSRFLVSEIVEEMARNGMAGFVWTLQDQLLYYLLGNFPTEMARVYQGDLEGLKREIARIMSQKEYQTIYERLAFSTLKRARETRISSGYSVEDVIAEVDVNLFWERFSRLRRRIMKMMPPDYDERGEIWGYDPQKLHHIRKTLTSTKRFPRHRLSTWKSPLKKSMSVIDMIPPPNWKENNDLFPRIPLIPETTNARKDINGRWVPVQSSEKSPAWTIPLWQEFTISEFADPPGLILYDPFWIHSRVGTGE